MTTLTTTPTETDNELYSKYMEQTSSQPVNLCLNLETGELSCYVSSTIGSSITGRAFHNVDLEWSIPSLRMKAVDGLYASIKEDCQTLLDHSEVVWDNGNFVGKLDQEAREAYDRVYDSIETQRREWDESDIFSVWEASTYFEPVSSSVLSECGLSVYSTEEEIRAAAEAEVEKAEVALDVEDVEEYLIRAQEEQQEELTEDLEVTVDYEKTALQVSHRYFYEVSVPVRIETLEEEVFEGEAFFCIGVEEADQEKAEEAGSWEGLVNVWPINDDWFGGSLADLARQVGTFDETFDLWSVVYNEIEEETVLNAIEKK